MQDSSAHFINSQNAVRFLSRQTTPLTKADRAQLMSLHLQGETSWSAGAIARFLGKAEQEQWLNRMNDRYHDRPLMRKEIALFPHLSLQACLALSQADVYFLHQDTDPAVILSEDESYYAFALETLCWAKEHLSAIHDARIPYAADKAFTVEDAQIISRCARIAARRYDDGTGALLSTLLHQTCFAPGIAKTVPSQSLAIALGHAIQACPLPETLQALTEVIQTIRHAGVKKKLERNLKPAHRALAERPELALTMSAQLKPGKKSTTLLAHCLESGYLLDSRFPWQTWCEQLLNSAAGRSLAESLIWLAEPPEEEPFTFLRNKKGYYDASGNALAAPEGCSIRLWHPLHATPEARQCWQRRITLLKIKQPFRQAFRETDYPLCSDSFAGVCLSLSQLTGLARKEGWQLHYGYLERRFACWRVQFAVDANLYPGMTGEGYSGEISLYDATLSPVTFATLPPVIASEIMRSLDLLVSVTKKMSESGHV